jgi:hypothetical protein
MNKLPDSERAKIVAMLLRVVSELAGGRADDDLQVIALMGEIIDLCYRSKIDSATDATGSVLFESVSFIDQKDWLFTVKKLGNLFEFEVAFGNEMKAAKLKKSMRWVSKAGIN